MSKKHTPIKKVSISISRENGLVLNTAYVAMAKVKSIIELVKKRIWRVLIERKRFAVRETVGSFDSCCGTTPSSAMAWAGIARSGDVSVGDDILI